MAKEASERIRERDDTARLWRRDQGPFARMVSGAALFIADTMDRIDGLVANAPSRFIGGMMYGAMRGAFYGIIACMVVIPFWHAAGVFAAGALLLGIMGASAAIYTVREGQGALDRRINNP